MDESFFLKYALQIKKQKNSKEEVINYIQEKIDITLNEDMITISKKEISFTVSSVMKQKLHQKNITKILEEKGYMVRF